MSQKLFLCILFAAGLAVSYYIKHHRINKKELACSLKTKCNVVVGSKYNKFLGIHNESLGVLYYGLFLAINLISLKFPILENIYVNAVALISAAAAALFSVYLTLVQVFKLKEYCQWCLVSAVISISIFIILLT